MVQQGTDKSLGHDHMSTFVVPVCSAVEGPSKNQTYWILKSVNL